MVCIALLWISDVTAEWLNISRDQFWHLGFFPGAGGNRLRRLILGLTWDIEPEGYLHRYDGISVKDSTDDGVPKFPKSWYVDYQAENQIMLFQSFKAESYIVSSHGMHSPSLKQVFPGRKSLKVYSNLRDSLRRWWAVFGKQWFENSYPSGSVNIPTISNQPMTIVEAAIKNHVMYYTRFFDCWHDHAVYILPGQSEFADFMIELFDQARSLPESEEFDQQWEVISRQGIWQDLMRNPYLLDPEFCQKQSKYLDYPVQQA